MDTTTTDKIAGLTVNIWDDYKRIWNKAHGWEVSVEYIERFEFYERAKKVYAIIHTGLIFTSSFLSNMNIFLSNMNSFLSNMKSFLSRLYQ